MKIKPKKLTEEDLDKIDKEAEEWRKSISKGLESLDRLDAEDFMRIINGRRNQKKNKRKN
jgi:hypothetical protein